MALLCDVDQCSGCLACHNICPIGAINLVEDNQGFIYPKINAVKCKKCNACESVCPPLNGFNGRNTPINVFAAWRNNESLRAQSASGGIASCIAEYAVSRGYVVVGAAITKDLVVRHCVCTTEEQLARLRKSKYVQSFTADIYISVKKMLSNGSTVVFFGTPCQCDAVKRVVGEDFDNKLFTIDLVCHGVPSPRYLKEHLLSFVEELRTVDSYDFRENNKYVFQVDMTNGKKIHIPYPKDSYLYAFMKNVLDRESCHTCNYSSTSRCSDISLGDFWGLKSVNTKNVTAEMHKGINAVLINTTKGLELFNGIKCDVFSEERDLTEVVRYNPFLRPIFKTNEERFTFRKNYCKIGFENAVKKLKRKYYLNDLVDFLLKKFKYKFTRTLKLFLK